ncbi:MAG TPA: lipocalin-like domain-containing protein [Candidatus Krumholzibacteria bacterium]|nr:lipocalin-like domain-containing protein [Candidatus Krumholzibacteria bacterium]HRX51955.1 lipocalin-like domain-containing protein [Candidatus Krumholzibacteria bacterium]
MRRAILLLLFLAGAATAAEWRTPGPTGRAWDFPADHHALRDYRNEWWYVTGHLAAAGEAEPRWGYQFTLFRLGVAPGEADTAAAWAASDLVMGHVALTDLRAGTHLFTQVMVRAVDPLGGFGAPGDSMLAWCAAPPGTDGRWTFALDGDGFRLRAQDRRKGLDLELTLRPERPVVFHGPGGYSPKSADGSQASLYYSYTRLATAGELDGEPVQGRSWFDREVFTGTLTGERVGWDWASLQLDDGRDLMLFELRREDGVVDFGRGTLVESDGRVVLLSRDQWTWTPTGRWTSPATGNVYPSGWRLNLPGGLGEVEVVPEVAGAENVGPPGGFTYWEGPVTFTGAAEGRGYVELTGYGSSEVSPETGR